MVRVRLVGDLYRCFCNETIVHHRDVCFWYCCSVVLNSCYQSDVTVGKLNTSSCTALKRQLQLC